ncbi:unnamed protein product [Ambrosiozyma monospora]|uniref:Unnamed protein product n=1 Tax=Ambrosiozyma monospora TaxID=43982 RepID=A0ACB5T3F1_AMBMO|nr:unnamed protein product [Ambrosiozyma monospora]
MDSKAICAQKLADHISSLSWDVENNDYSDVILKVDEKEYHLHKVVLFRFSYFKGLLNWPTSVDAKDPSTTNDSLDVSKKQVIGLNSKLILWMIQNKRFSLRATYKHFALTTADLVSIKCEKLWLSVKC